MGTLCLTRKIGESIVLAGAVLGKIKVVRAGAGRCRLTFDFPASVTIAREEIATKGAVDGHVPELREAGEESKAAEQPGGPVHQEGDSAPHAGGIGGEDQGQAGWDRGALLKLLAGLEWGGTTDCPDGGTAEACPYCDQAKYLGEHLPTCELAMALGRSKLPVPALGRNPVQIGGGDTRCRFCHHPCREGGRCDWCKGASEPTARGSGAMPPAGGPILLRGGKL